MLMPLRYEVDAMRALPLPNTNTRGPPKEWIAEHGKTPRYAKFLRESFSPEATIAQDRELDQELGFDPAVPDLGDLGFEGLGDYVELPRDVLPDGSGTYDNDPLYEPDLTDEEGQLPAHPEGEITNEEAADLMDVEPEPLDRIPEGVAMAFAERFEHHEAIGQVAAPVQEGDKGGEIIVELGGGLVKVQRPCASRDDVTEVSLDLGLTYEGMIKELKALESLSVGDMMWTIDPKQRVISTRWVVAAKNERIDGKETPIVRCRIVARDYSTGPSASQLGISSPTASGEALKLFLAAIGAEGFNILGLDVSTAFLFAWLGDEKVVVSMPEGCVGPGGEKLYLRLKKALYGLRSAALHWTRHLSGLLGKLFGLKPCPTEPCLFTGYFKNKRVFVLSYVDDLLLAGASTDDLYEMVELLRKELKLKVTADLAKDGKIHFLGREILRSEPGGDLKFGMDPGYMQDVLEEYKLENAKGLPTPPCLRDLLDKSLDEASLQVPLTPEAAARYRRALGKLSWLSATRGDLVYYISVLARGQSSPLEVHERAMRAVLRYLKTVVHYFQVFPRQRHSHMLLRAYVDASWGSERSVERRSISGGCLMLGKACIKSWARLQQSVALSSAESELYALVEGSREALGARCAVGHILGHEGEIVPHIYCDSEAAVNISKMEGLRKLRHIDIRACFIQTEVQAGAIKVFSVKGTENPADIFTKYGTEYQKHLDGLWAVHRKLWVVVKTMSNLSDHWAVEWPARCAYWKQTESFFERLSYPVYTSYIDGCAAGLLGNDGHQWKSFNSNSDKGNLFLHCTERIPNPDFHSDDEDDDVPRKKLCNKKMTWRRPGTLPNYLGNNFKPLVCFSRSGLGHLGFTRTDGADRFGADVDWRGNWQFPCSGRRVSTGRIVAPCRRPGYLVQVNERASHDLHVDVPTTKWVGRRRARAKPPAKPKQKLDTQFDCLFCGSLKAVEVKLVRLEKIGFLKCRVCNAGFSSPISYLSEAVDVYSDWVDKVAEVNYEPEEPAAKKSKVSG
ncbi:Retrovirus-related Pol polyprotein from transposon TNT 1-94 [Symbiodinium microadriaticum]|uniref:Retrovirus-related Pol polyprotein from transposon TNT 1-94 n=1 Tax=Symbiodinium microadriaticum TaxID=2951 RepID=A0A1Q9CL99_SYMMI|nr:Retrovirus-related Pol polyprotein from transposon TNT 1-94 [Symbiodinium microadriaticum]